MKNLKTKYLKTQEQRFTFITASFCILSILTSLVLFWQLIFLYMFLGLIGLIIWLLIRWVMKGE